MNNRAIRRIKRIDLVGRLKYTILTRGQVKKKEAINVTQFVEKINRINLSPQQLRELGLPSDWQRNISTQFIERVVTTADRFKKDLKELSKR